MKKIIKQTLIAIVFLMVSAPAIFAQVKIVPGNELYLNPTNPGRGYYDLMIHNVVVAEMEDSFALDRIVFEFMSGNNVMMTKTVNQFRVISDSKGLNQMVSQGMSVFFHGQLLSEQGLESVFDTPLTLSADATLESGEALMLTRQQFSFDFIPSSVRVRAIGKKDSGDVEYTDTATIKGYQNAVVYSAPLKGTWLMAAIPSIQSHHRYNPSTEFAVDYFKPGGEGTGKLNNNDSLDPENYGGYGEEVYAAASGEVAFVIDDEVQNRAAFFPKKGESRQQTGQRMQQYVMQRMMKDFRRAAAGNIVVIKHEAKGKVEYSSYGHLKAGSVRVSVGDKVETGDVIGEVGDTGDSPNVHLHFQVNTGADPFFSRSLPFRFKNFGPVRAGTRDPGRFVKSN